LPFTIIAPTPGLTTAERILEIIRTHPQGITVKDLSDRINRPISMVQHCVKSLQGNSVIQAKLNLENREWVYYPISPIELKK
jgi:predicted transcriptional regulator